MTFAARSCEASRVPVASSRTGPQCPCRRPRAGGLLDDNGRLADDGDAALVVEPREGALHSAGHESVAVFYVWVAAELLA